MNTKNIFTSFFILSFRQLENPLIGKTNHSFSSSVLQKSSHQNTFKKGR